MNWIAATFGVLSAVALGALNAFINIWTNGYDVTSLVFLFVLPAGAGLLGMGAGFGAGLGAGLTNSVLDYRAPFLLIGALSGALAFLVYLFVLYQLLFPGAPISSLFEFSTELFHERTLSARSVTIDMEDVGVWVGYGSFLAAALGGLCGALIGDEARRKFATVRAPTPAASASQSPSGLTSRVGAPALPPAIDTAIAILAAVARAQTSTNYMTRDWSRIAVAGTYGLWLPRDEKRDAEVKSLSEARSREFFEKDAISERPLDELLTQFPKKEKNAATVVVLNCMIIAMSDGPLGSDERALVQQIADGLGVDITKKGSSFDTAQQTFEAYWIDNFDSTAKLILSLFLAGGADQVFEHNADAYSDVREVAKSQAYAIPWGDAAIAFASRVMSKVAAIMPEAERLKILDQIQVARKGAFIDAVKTLEGGKISDASLPDDYTMGTLFFGLAIDRCWGLARLGIARSDSFSEVLLRLATDLGGGQAQQKPADVRADFSDRLEQDEWDEEHDSDDEDLELEGKPASAITGFAPVAAEASASEIMFWQSIKDSTDPADFTAYLQQFPSGIFRQLALNRLAALGAKLGGE
jgi:tellurite resistance protein